MVATDSQTKHAPEPLHGALSADISNAVVKLLADCTGRGPTKARTTLDRDLVMVVLQDTLSKGEQFLVDNDQREQVLEMRRSYQTAMEVDCRAAVERLTGRTVVAFMSTNHIAPDVAAEIFVLAPRDPDAAATA
jgi:uncharacterized protein YbcI